MVLLLVQLVRLIGLYFFTSGLIFFLKPASLRKYVVFWSRGMRMYLVSAMRLFSGFVLLAAARHCRLEWFVVAFGVLNIVLGLPYFIKGVQGMRSAASSWNKRPAARVRILGGASVACGSVLLYCAF